MLFHRAERRSSLAEEVRFLFDLASRVMPDSARTEAVEKLESEPPEFEVTVAEMAVGFELPEPVGADDDEQEAGRFRDAISDAFDRGLEVVREVQRAHYAVRRTPVRLVTREALPMAVPFGIRRVFDDDGEPLPVDVPMSLYMLNMNLPVAGDDLDAAEQNMFGAALREQSLHGPFTSYLDFRREAQVALSRDGAYRAAVLFTATACEVLLDDLLAHLLWQDGLRPETAAAVFDSWLTSRVKREYQPRLGGRWDTAGGGPVAGWSHDVAGLRNRVVHAGYQPTLDETRRAADAADNLQTYLGNLLSNRTGRYPRTALILPGEAGLRRRGRWTRRLDELRHSPDEIPWTETFGRWRLAMQRARTDSPVATAPSAATAFVYAVLRAGGHLQWVLHDPAAGLAAAIRPEALVGYTSGHRENLDAVVAPTSREPDHGDVSVHLKGVSAAAPPAGAWVPEYRLVPLAGVMVDGQNLDPV